MDLPFYDEDLISPVVPVVRDGSGIFHAYALHVHLKLCPHAGIEATMREHPWSGKSVKVQSR